MRLALVTCQSLPRAVEDDAPLFQHLRDVGQDFESVAWDDPAARWSEFDAAIVRTTWDYCPRLPEFLAWARRVAQQTRLFNPCEVLTWNTNKRYLAAVAAEGAPIIPTEWVTPAEAETLPERLAARGWGRAFVKPVVGAGSDHTLRVEDDPQSRAAAVEFLRDYPVAEGALVQPYLDRVESVGELSLVFFGGQFSHAVCKVPPAGDFRVQVNWGGRYRAYTTSASERGVAEGCLEAAGRAFGLTAPLLYARVDLLQSPEGRWWLNELELVEPALYFEHAPDGPARLLAAIRAAMTAASV
jgi:glutathione synthase/RimK-type ligase-like ATP-grasp enzyme